MLSQRPSSDRQKEKEYMLSSTKYVEIAMCGAHYGVGSVSSGDSLIGDEKIIFLDC